MNMLAIDRRHAYMIRVRSNTVRLNYGKLKILIHKSYFLHAI
jgi:hypothetical protein